ncbi:MAG: hypothetical protein LOD92_02860 [Bacillales bacterium]
MAREYLEKSGKSAQIRLLFGDALELTEEIKMFAPYDFIFLDAAKSQYRKFFELYSRYLGKNGIVFTDNVLFKGLVCREDIENRNIRALARKIRCFNEWLAGLKEFDTVFLPVGDGVAISRKR